MKERPILFNGDMVRAILSGEKTQTRRMVKRIPAIGEPDAWCHKKDDPDTVRIIGDYRRFCPFGEVGDRLWVRETAESDEDSCDLVVLSRYSADKKPVFYRNCEDKEFDGSVAHWWCKKRSCPSILMPRWASRITLEIVGVRIERLNGISKDDAMAEGTHAPIQFALLWDSIYKNWEENPWVWVVEFKRVGT